MVVFQVLIGVVIAVLGVQFLRQAVASENASELLELGAVLALVIVALTYYVSKLVMRGNTD